MTITNVSSGASQRVLTGPDGSFSVTGLPAATYTVEVESAGYKRMSRQNVELVATGPVNLTIVMEPGSMQEAVEIKGTSPMVQGNSSDVSMGVGTRTLHELPVVDRNHQHLTTLMTGITPPQVVDSNYVDPEHNRWFSTNGQTPLTNIWHTDGTLNREPFRGTASRIQPMESVQQMNLVTSNYPAHMGFSGGLEGYTLTRPGTNDWHGSLFAFHSNNNLNARSFFSPAGNPTPRLAYNQYGATAGGHIVRDKFFFMGSYEGTFDRGQRTQMTTIPTAEMRAGIFTNVPDVMLFNPRTGNQSGSGRTPFLRNVIPPGSINPFSAALVAALPLPNQPGMANNYVANVPYKNDWQKADARLDGHFSDRTSAFLRYGYSNNHAEDPSILGTVIGAGGLTRLLAQNVVGSFTHSFTPAFLTDFRFGYNRYDEHIRNFNNQNELAASLGLPLNNNFVPSILITGLAPIGTPANVPMHGVDNTFNWVWSWNWHANRHDVKFGTDIRRIRSDGFSNLAFGPTGAAIFGPGATALAGNPPLTQFGAFTNSFASFLLGAPNATGTAALLGTPTYRQTEYSAWLGDDIKATRNLTVNLGVRYEIYSPIEPRRAGEAMFFDPDFSTLNFAGIGGVGMHVQRYDTNNVAPRAGFAYRIREKTVVRGGYGISYFHLPLRYSGFMPTAVATSSGVPGTFVVAPGQFAPSSFGTVPAGFTPVNGVIAPNIPLVVNPLDAATPYIQSFSFKVQQELFSSFMFDLGYVGTLGRHLDAFRELNFAAPGAGIAGLPFGRFGRTASTLLHTNDLNNNYNSLQVNLTKRMSYGVTFQGAYTYSKALGYTDATGRLLNPADLRSNYGPMDWDRTHVLTISHLWELPFGTGHTYAANGVLAKILGDWQLNGMFHWATGAPFMVVASPLACNCPGFGAVPVSVNGPVSFTDTRNVGQPIFNTAAFSIPVNGIGNLGRNSLRGPGYKTYDMSLFKAFRFKERYKIEARGEAYNLTNSPRFQNPVALIESPNFGQIVNTANGAAGRQINLALRLLF